MDRSEPRVFTIPPGCPFLPTLVEAVESGDVIPGLALDSAAWAEATIYLPTKRAARALATLLAERAAGRAQLLPRILALGETGQAEFDLADGFAAAGIADPPIAPLERRLILARLVQEWAQRLGPRDLRREPDVPVLVPTSAADAVVLAGDIERLMDALTVENLPWEEIRKAVETDFSEYYKLTWDFLRIAAEAWPGILQARGASDPARRQAELIRAEARRLRERPAAVIAAGSTGSVPATAELLDAIARMPNGAVILPGLDTELDEEGWDAVAGAGREPDAVHGHPQAQLHRLVTKRICIPRSAVQVLGTPPPAAAARTSVLSQALRPAETTDRWAEIDADERSRLAALGCEGVAVVEAADEREEALAAAIALREALEIPGRTAALVTPDRGLAARVSAELARWDVVVEDSAGVPLSDTRAGRLARLAAEAAAFDFHPARLIALLAHPDVRLGGSRAEVERAATALEIGVLRGPAPAPGLGGLLRAFEGARHARPRHAARPRSRLTSAEWETAGDLLRRLAHAFDGFGEVSFGTGPLQLASVAAAHRRVLDRLREPDADEDASAEAVSDLFDDVALLNGDVVRGRFHEYPTFFAALARERVLARPPQGGHRRVKILGLLEARLLPLDCVVLGGLDEGIWPPRVETDAFLNRPMRAGVGLSPPERRIGQTAHDFVQALGCRDAVITRAVKREGSPMVPSRFLQRLKAFVGAPVWACLIERGNRYRDLARALDHAPPAEPLRRPAPKPDATLFPRRLSVTDIETLVRDPYGIFAKHVLKLDALDPVALAPGAADRGTIVHEILARFAQAHPGALPPDASARLHQIALDCFRRVAEEHPHLYAEWWPRFQRLATEYLRWEEERRPVLDDIAVERSGKLDIPLPDGTVFTLRARADRIERWRSGSFTIVDFKTGKPPTSKVVYAGFSPQLTLEAAILMRGGFEGVGGVRAAPELMYVHASGGRVPFDPQEVGPPSDESPSVPELIEEHLDGLTGLVAAFVSGDAAYLSRPFAQYAKAYSDYDHLARVKEWSAASADEADA